jgi:hypothetical protein
MAKLKNSSPLDHFLRDEAKDMLGRTPAQGWLKPERVELNVKRVTLRNVHKKVYSAADYFRVDLNAEDAESAYARTGQLEFEFVLDSPRTGSPTHSNRVRPHPDILERFLRLATAADQQILRFASNFGALLIFDRIERGKIPGKLVIVESCEIWRYFAASMRSLLRIASCFHTNCRPDPVDWQQIGDHPASLVAEKAKIRDPRSSSSFGGEEAWTVNTHFVRKGADRDRKMWARLLNTLLDLGRVRPWLVWEGVGSSARPKLLFSGPSLLSYLALELCLRASKHDAFAVCSYCNRQYAPLTRAPKAGQRNFCADCRVSGVPIRLAQRSRRERLREGR